MAAAQPLASCSTSCYLILRSLRLRCAHLFPEHSLQLTQALYSRRQPSTDQGLRFKILNVAAHAFLQLFHQAVLHGRDIRQPYELPRLSRRAVNIDGKLHKSPSPVALLRWCNDAPAPRAPARPFDTCFTVFGFLILRAPPNTRLPFAPLARPPAFAT